jgi:hypothetical protein
MRETLACRSDLPDEWRELAAMASLQGSLTPLLATGSGPDAAVLYAGTFRGSVT